MSAPSPPLCPDHKPAQHRDRKRPWCNTCGWTDPTPVKPAELVGTELADLCPTCPVGGAPLLRVSYTQAFCTSDDYGLPSRPQPASGLEHEVESRGY